MHLTKLLALATIPVGDRFEGNRLLASTQMGVTVSGKTREQNLLSDAVPVARDAIFKNNFTAFQPIGIIVDRGNRFTLLRDNRTKAVPEPIHNAVLDTVIP